MPSLVTGRSVNLQSDLGEYDTTNNFTQKDQAQFNNAVEHRNSQNDNWSVKLTCKPKSTSIDVAMKARECTPLYGLYGDMPLDRAMVFVFFLLKQGI